MEKCYLETDLCYKVLEILREVFPTFFRTPEKADIIKSGLNGQNVSIKRSLG